MNYFDKIEAYTTGALSELDHLVFETALTQNRALQQELEAYQLAQSLFGFAGEALSEETIITADSATLAEDLINFTANSLSEAQILSINTTTETESTDLAEDLINFTANSLSEAQIVGINTTTSTESTDLADSLINFTANNLSEAQILAVNPISAKAPIIRRLQPKRNRTAWLVAASMLFILSLIGSQFYTSQNVGQGSSIVAEIPASIEKSPIKGIAINNSVEEALVVNIPEKRIKPNYPPAKIKTTKKITPIISRNHLVVADEVEDIELELAKTTLENPIAMNTIAEEITSAAVIPLGQTIEYQAKESIILTEGFSVKPGTNFTAATTQSTTLKEVNSNSVISDKESVKLKANTAITLKPGFHAKAGASFKAEIGR